MNREQLFAKYRRGGSGISREELFAKYKQKKNDNNLQTFGKGAASGALGILDLPQSIASLAEEGVIGGAGWLHDKFAKTPLDQSRRPQGFFGSLKSPSMHIKEKLRDYGGIDLDTQPENSEQRRLKNIGEWVGGGINGKLQGGIKNIAKQVGKHGATNAALGEVSHELQEVGANPFVADLAAAATPRGLKLATRKGEEGLRWLGGISPSKLDIEKLEAFKEAKVKPQINAVTEAKLPAIAHRAVSHLPFFGERLRKSYDITQSDIKKYIGDIGEEMSPTNTSNNREYRQGLYEQERIARPKDNLLYPAEAIKEAEGVKSYLSKAAKLSKQGENVLDVADAQLKKFAPGSGEFGQIKGLKFPIEDVILSRKEVGDMGHWKNPSKYEKDLNDIYFGYGKDIENYGKNVEGGQEWLSKYQNAQSAQHNFYKRAELEKMLQRGMDKATGTPGIPLSGDIRTASLASVLNDPDNLKDFQRILGKEKIHKIETLGKVMGSLTQAARNAPNPSGTAFALKSWGASAGVITGLAMEPISTLIGLMGTEAVTRLLTSDKFLDRALIAAKKAKAGKAVPTRLRDDISREFKNASGINPTVFNNELYRVQEANERRRKLPRINIRNVGGQ